MKKYKIGINQRVIEAINFLISDKFNGDKSKIRSILGVKSAKFSEILNERMAAGLDVIQNLCIKLNVNPEWIIIGDGEMIKSKKQEPINNMEGISQDERITKLLNIIEKQQDTINNQQEIINNLVNKQEKTSAQQDNDAECATA